MVLARLTGGRNRAAQPAPEIPDAEQADPNVAAALEALRQAEAAEQRLADRLAVDDTITPAQLREAADAVTLAHRRVESARRHATEGRRAELREGVTQLHQRARRLAGNAPQRIAEAQELHRARGVADAGISGDNAEAHAISEEGLRLRAEAREIGVDLDALALELGVGGLEFHSGRLLGGVKVGEFEIAKHPQPHIMGGYDPGLVARLAPPPPPPPPPGLVCYERTEGGGTGRGFKAHVLMRLDRPTDRPLNGQRCMRCGQSWTAAEAHALWGIAMAPRREPAGAH